MTTTTVFHAPPLTTASIRRPAVLPNLLRSEWAKLASVRSTYWNLVVAAAMVVVGVVAAIGAAHSHTHTAGFDPVSNSLGGVMVAQLAIGVLGVLAVTSEYSTGMIRSTLAAAPQRGTLIGAKAAVFGAIAFAVGPIASLVTFLVGQAILGSQGVSLGAPGAAGGHRRRRYLGLLGVLAIGLGTVIRRSAGAIAVLVGLLLVVPLLAPLLPTAIRDTVGKFLPYIAGQAIFNTTKDTTTLSPWAGLAVFALYAAAALAIAIVLIRHRDA